MDNNEVVTEEVAAVVENNTGIENRQWRKRRDFVSLAVLSTKKKMNYTIDLLITMVTDQIAEETGKDRKEILAV